MERDTSSTCQLVARAIRAPSRKRRASPTAAVRLHFLKRARGKSLIGKSPGDYEAWKPSRRAHAAAACKRRFVPVGRRRRRWQQQQFPSPENPVARQLRPLLAGRKRAGGRGEGERGQREEERGETEAEKTTCFDTANLHLLRGALETNCVNLVHKLVCRAQHWKLCRSRVKKHIHVSYS